MDKKNTILLTVIAVATLLVAVVGATFAYFTAQAGAGASAKVDVQTNTTDTAMFQGFKELKIDANQTNFGVDLGSLRDSTEGSVTFTASNAGTGNESYCYNLTLSLEADNGDDLGNTFIYSLPKKFGESSDQHFPELVLNIWKKSVAVEDVKTANDDDLETEQYHYVKSMYIDETHQLSYVDKILENAKICDRSDSTYTCGEQADQKIAGYDITVFGNGKQNYVYDDDTSYYVATDGTVKYLDTQSKQEQTLAPSEANVFQDLKKLQVPIVADLDGDSYETDKTYEHKMQVTSKGGSVVDYWKFTITFVNYSDSDVDKVESTAGAGDQNLNTNRKFKAKILFDPVNKTGQCSPAA